MCSGVKVSFIIGLKYWLFRQKNKSADNANSVEMINLVKLSVEDYLDSAPSSVNPIHDEKHSFREMNV